jgi:acyl-CoA synthetase (AMP-forming)/AMP-acid ligase II
MYWLDALPDRSVGQALIGATARFGDRETYTFPARRLSLNEIDRQSDRVAKALLGLGIRRGDRVAVWMANHYEWTFIYFGLLKIGAVLVPLNSRFKPNELEFCLKNSGVKTLIFKREVTDSGKDYGVLLREFISELDSFSEHSSTEQFPQLRTIVDLAAEPMAGAIGFDRFLNYGEVISDEALESAEKDVGPGDEAIIQYTSGTTSFPKGARLSHAGILRGGRETIAWMQIADTDTFFSVQPFYHCGGSVTTMLAPIVSGCRVVTQTYYECGAALAMMEDERATVMVGHQPHFIEYMNHPTFAQRRFALERMLVIAPPEVFWMVRDKFGLDGLVSGYGMTETHMFGTATSLLTDSMETRFNTNGSPNAGVKVEIRDPDDNVLAQGQEGEIFMRVPYPMLGYLNEPHLTRDVLDADGWYRTGDKGVLGPDGNLKLLGRVRDMIRVGGENLSGAEVEACLLSHPAVKQAAVVAAPDKRLGEVVAGFVELKTGEVASAAELIAHCKVNLASFKVPREINFVSKWPMSGSGKIQKRLLQADAVRL